MSGAELFNQLPEDIISSILSLTSPKDTFSFSLVSSSLRSVAASDFLWQTFLPSDYKHIIDKSVTPLKYSSKKELFVRLCNSILIDGGNKSFALEKSSGKKSYIISAKELSILYGEEPDHWTWKSVPDSRFSKVAELKVICRLEIKASLKTNILSPNAKYGVYFIMKISHQAFGLNSVAAEISVEIGNRKEVQHCVLGSTGMTNFEEKQRDQRLPYKREDGWMEIEIGEFNNGGDEEEVTVSLMEVKGCHVKGGLIIEGIEFRPKH
ncbi:PREDICTED: F-box protein PP2-B15-like [Nicotiana attenuata]|uniref:F-box protein pp2-b15 n=1 Tax=Nicotiana attenuata TaxID=49451 RepID=A0A1J6IFN0_NICAT|nr:PREDICTED: F-box protein PP2-B15-like [Nicotiana attenuata]OIS97746.1 f-box protein pp2-b15 [Nicotiana attenuata]